VPPGVVRTHRIDADHARYDDQWFHRIRNHNAMSRL
jgi:hypothetical protein